MHRYPHRYGWLGGMDLSGECPICVVAVIEGISLTEAGMAAVLAGGTVAAGTVIVKHGQHDRQVVYSKERGVSGRKPPALTGEEAAIMERANRNEPLTQHQRKVLKRALKKAMKGEKVHGDRNKQKKRGG